MAESTPHEASSSSSRRDREERDRRRHRESSRRYEHDDERKHSSRSDSSKRDDKDRHRGGDGDRHRHHHRSSHHRSSDSRDRHRERDGESRGEHKRRHGEDEKGDKERHRDEGRRHASRSHRQHHRGEAESSRGSRSDKDRHHRDNRHSDKQPATDFIPTSESLRLTSHVTVDEGPSEVERDATPSKSVPKLKRDDWMMAGRSETISSDRPETQTEASADDDDASVYFASLGKARVKAPRPEKPDPEKLKISSRELNTQLVEGKSVDEYEVPTGANAPPQLGAPGYQWRMMKLKRTLEAAEQEGRRVEEVALERYASLDDFEQAQAERRFLDGKDQGKGKGAAVERSTPTLQSVARRSYLLASGGTGEGGGSSRSGTESSSASRPGSRQGFKRPGESSNPATPTSAHSSRPPRNVGFETPSSKPTTPTAIPSVFTPVVERPAPRASSSEANAPQAGVVLDDGSSDPDRPILTADQLNKLQAKIFQAELMGDTHLESLKAEYERESARAKAHRSLAGDRGGAFAASSTSGPAKPSNSAGVLVQDGERELQVLPTLDARGRMYDIGSLSSEPESNSDPSRKRKLKGRDTFEARDSKTGQIIRYSGDDDSVSLGDLVRQEKFSAGSRWAKDPDAELAANIMSDAGFSGDLDQQDEEAHRYAKKKMRSDALKRQFAINDFAKTKQALDRCRFCWQNEGSSPPRVTVVSSGYRAYLAVPDVESVTPSAEDHMLIVPMQHHLSLLEADDDTWDELKNFQKCLMQLAASQSRSVVFFETVLSIKAQRHCVMEAVLVPKAAMDLLPGVFKESLRSAGGEWSTHRKVIDFSAGRPFRNALVPNLPYFAVSWDYKWTTGYGHVIENVDGDMGGKAEEDGGGGGGDAYDVGEMTAGSSGGKFDPYFARDIVRGVLEDLDNEDEDGEGGGGYMRSFGKSKRRSEDEKRRTKDKFKKTWDTVDWTKMLSS
ncbi:uncharacterized protein UTRI_03138_B [Ustilago trichophora]|uniref:Cell cycle control protein cwf19 n=1 Tax=Ustilago trichophora TaxID=86804 RepID=A0A5C3E4F2_9BASI|nr:uncharacterized protein UTRI_03138_B [Ustilago trichophora]